MSAPADPVRERDLQRALALVRLARDPALPGLIISVGLVLMGFAAIVLAYYGAARTIYVFLQMPEIISGALGGLALIGVGGAVFTIQSDRRIAARERRKDDEALGEIAELVALAPRLRALARNRAERTKRP
ncbi:MAG TPA: hypothetical protein VKA30_03660 [Actinomycetota bacterium]|nr:hypothetical protein [Actinomycetota bacterium]